MESNDNLFVGITVYNSEWESACKRMKNYLEYVEIPKLVEISSKELFDDNPYVTLIYKTGISKGPNWLSWFTRIKNRDLFNDLKSNPTFTLQNPIIDTFDNPDSRVLKLNIIDSGCNRFPLFEDYHNAFIEYFGEDKYGGYQPHITLTYLRPDTPDSIIEDIKSNILISSLTKWDLSEFIFNDNIKSPIL